MLRITNTSIAALTIALLLCLIGLIVSGPAFAQQCVDNGDGTVTDNNTGQMWQKEPAVQMDYSMAIDYSVSLSLGGHSGWQPPSKDELLDLSRSPCKNMMDLIPYFHWSYSRSGNDDQLAWYVDLKNGDAKLEKMSTRLFVRAVRYY